MSTNIYAFIKTIKNKDHISIIEYVSHEVCLSFFKKCPYWWIFTTNFPVILKDQNAQRDTSNKF